MDDIAYWKLRQQMFRPAAGIIKHSNVKVDQARSWIGGLPRAPAGFEWPTNPSGARNTPPPLIEATPLHFLAQIDLGQLPTSMSALLPFQGSLLFFVDLNTDNAGGDWWRVMLVGHEGAQLQPTPKGTRPDCRHNRTELPFCAISFVASESWCAYYAPAAELTELWRKDESGYYSAKWSAFLARIKSDTTLPRVTPEWGRNFVGGYGAASNDGVQEAAFELASHLNIVPGSELRHWQQLAQFNSDLRLGYSLFGGASTHFFMHENDRMSGRFDRVVAVIMSD